jgi:tripartite-type tricarboxylate transporter receptor subunit TctC
MALLGMPSLARASVFPSRPITIVLPFSPGGLSDVVARAVAEELRRKLGVPIVIENRTGGNTIPAAVAVARAAPDGHTLGWYAGNTFVSTTYIFPDAPYAVSDFAPVIMFYRGPMVLAVSNQVPANSITDYVAHIRRSGQPAIIGATSVGGTAYLMASVLGTEAGIAIEPAGYRGGPDLVLALQQNSLPAAGDIVDTFLQAHRSRNLKIIGIASERRIDLLPDIQTFAEAGFPNATAYFWQGIAAPRGTPAPILNQLHAALAEAIAAPAVRARLSADLEVLALSPDDFAGYIAAERARWIPVMERLNLRRR